MISQQELAEYFNESAETYRFLSQMFFKELNEEAIEELAQAEYPESTGNECLDKGYGLLQRYFAFSATDRRTQLACEYARIFLAAGVFTRERRTAIPYESVFTSEEHIVMQDSRDDVVARYLCDGFQVNPDLHEPEDHLAFELEYLSSMNARAAELVCSVRAFANDAELASDTTPEAAHDAELARNVARQIEFIEGHLLNWIPQLREVAQDFAKLTFYIGVLLIAQGTLEQDRDMLRDLQVQLAEAADTAA